VPKRRNPSTCARVRAAAREEFIARIRLLASIADDENAAPRDRIHALMVMARVGLDDDDQAD